MQTELFDLYCDNVNVFITKTTFKILQSKFCCQRDVLQELKVFRKLLGKIKA